MEKPLPTIREAMPSDMEQILGLWEQLSSLHARLDPIFTTAPDGREHYRRWLRHHMEQPDSILLVAEVEKRVVGYCLAQLQTMPPVMRYQQIGAISDMAVEENSRGLHIGRVMYQEMERRFFERGVRRIELKTSSFNALANHFWEEVCGFGEFVKMRFKNL